MMSVGSSGSASGLTGYDSITTHACESLSAKKGVGSGCVSSNANAIDGIFKDILCCEKLMSCESFIPMDVSSSFWKGVIITLNDLNIKSNGIIYRLLNTIKRNLGKVKLNIGQRNGCSCLALEVGMLEKEKVKEKIKDCVCLCFDEISVKKQMEQEKYFLRKNGENYCCIEKMSYAQLFGLPLGSEELLYTCAAFFLFHELYHLNSFAMHKFDREHGYEEANRDLSVCNVNLDSIKTLFTCKGTLKHKGDDARNTIWNIYMPRENPGEFELLNALCHTPTIRLYYGNSLNFKDHLVQEACRNLMIDAFTEPALIEYTDSSKIDFKDYTNPQRLTKANLKVFLFEQLRFK